MMDRLTESRTYYGCEFMDDGTAVYLNKLSKYEDTGIEPEQIRKFDELYLDKCREVTALTKQIPKWISASKRLPKKDGDYLVSKGIFGNTFIEICSFATDLFEIDPCDFKRKKGKSGFYKYDGDFGYVEITKFVKAWMPLPESYKGE